MRRPHSGHTILRHSRGGSYIRTTRAPSSSTRRNTLLGALTTPSGVSSCIVTAERSYQRSRGLHRDCWKSLSAEATIQPEITICPRRRRGGAQTVVVLVLAVVIGLAGLIVILVGGRATGDRVRPALRDTLPIVPSHPREPVARPSTRALPAADETVETTPDAAVAARTRDADTRVARLVALTREAISAGDLDLAAAHIEEAVRTPGAANTSEADELRRQIIMSTDKEALHAELVGLPPDEFRALRKRGTLPASLSTGVSSLDAATLDLALGQITSVLIDRDRIRRQEWIESKRRKAMEVAEAAAETSRRQRENEAAVAAERQAAYAGTFDPRDGSHLAMTRMIKETMHNPESYAHVSTTVWDTGDHLIVETVFRGTNIYGGVVTSTVLGEVTVRGTVVDMVYLE